MVKDTFSTVFSDILLYLGHFYRRVRYSLNLLLKSTGQFYAQVLEIAEIMGIYHTQKVSEYDQEIPQLQTADQPKAP